MGRMEVDVDQPLTFYRDKWAARKAEGRGDPETGEDIKRVSFVMYTTSADSAREVAAWLEERGVTTSNYPDDDSPTEGQLGGLVAEKEIVNFLDDLTEIDTVLVIHYMSPGGPQGRREVPKRLPVQTLHGIEAWHAAGIKGTGVDIGVIDEGFRGIHPQ